MSTVAKTFHLLAIAHFAYGIYYDLSFVLPHELKLRGYDFGGKFIYLTFLNFILQGVYFAIALLNDFAGTNKPTAGPRPLIRRVRDYIFGSLAFPMAFNVGGIYWLLYSIDREMVFPKALDAFFPWWLNHFVHSNIMAFVVLEMLLLHHKYPCRKSSLIGLGAFLAAYIVWIHVVWYKTGFWVYPLLEVLNLPQKLGFYAFTVAVPNIFYFLGCFLNSLVWHKGRLSEAPKVKKGKKSKSA